MYSCMLCFTSSCIIVWSESSSFAGMLRYVVQHSNSCYTHPSIPVGGGRKHSCGVHCGGSRLLLPVCLCMWMGVSQDA